MLEWLRREAAGLNLIKDTVLVSDGQKGSSPLVDLSLARTGIRLAFDSNRMSNIFKSVFVA